VCSKGIRRKVGKASSQRSREFQKERKPNGNLNKMKLFQLWVVGPHEKRLPSTMNWFI